MKIGLKNFAYIFTIVFVASCAGGKFPGDNLLALEHQPANVVILIADGCGFNHFSSADYYECNQTPCQPYENFPVRLAMSTYPAGSKYDANTARASFNYVEKCYTDSAAAATAMACGVKTYNKTLGLDVNGRPVLNLVERAEQLGKATGVVTSVFFSDATPAGFVTHDASRKNLSQIAADIINRSPADVIMGCGHPAYDADGRPRNPHNYKYIGIADWAALVTGSAGGDADGDGTPDHWTLVQTRTEFQKLRTGPTPKRVFGLAQAFKTLQEDRSGDAFAAPYQVPLTQTVPTLEEMTVAALNVLDEDPDGFFLMIEGGATDWASHDNHSGRLIEEMNDFNKSVEAVLTWVHRNSSWDRTLVIVTADHETGHLTGPPRRSPSAKTGPDRGDLVGNGIANLPTMEWHSKDHTNSLVPFFAKGHGAQLFEDTIDGYDPVRGSYIDNTDIANVIFALWHTH